MTENNENIISENVETGVKEKESSFNLLKEVWEWIYTIAIALAIAFLIKTYLFDIVRVDGPSMNPTLTHNDRLIITKLGYEPDYGDIVILDSTYKDRQEYYHNYSGGDANMFEKAKLYMGMPTSLKRRYYVKRVIAMEGDTIDIVNGDVILNGEVLEEDYFDGKTAITDMSVRYPVTVSEGHVFVMGDNRSNSKDSRSSSLGEVPVEALLGKAQIRVWPFSAIKTF
ncbi:MAG: signal peptidase I [Ruminococcaceae bacterium]|nr:signal peptidase I [Oscillospiraceae bacterium]